MASSEYEEEGLRLPVLKTDVQVQWTEGQEHCGVMVTTALTSHLFFLTSAQLAAFCSQGSLTAKKMKKVERKQELTVVKNDIVTP